MHEVLKCISVVENTSYFLLSVHFLSNFKQSTTIKDIDQSDQNAFISIGKCHSTLLHCVNMVKILGEMNYSVADELMHDTEFLVFLSFKIGYMQESS